MYFSFAGSEHIRKNLQNNLKKRKGLLYVEGNSITLDIRKVKK